MQEMFLRSPSSEGDLHFGMTVTNSCFQTLGHTEVLVISLKMSDSGMARRTANLCIRAGKMSPLTIDFGFLKALILPATWYGCRLGSARSKVLGTSAGSRGSNYELIRLKKTASSSAT